MFQPQSRNATPVWTKPGPVPFFPIETGWVLKHDFPVHWKFIGILQLLFSTESFLHIRYNRSTAQTSQWGYFRKYLQSIKKPFGRGPTTPEIGDLPIIVANYLPMPSMGLVYLPTRMVDFYGKLVGKYTVRPMDGIWVTKSKDPPSTLYACRVPTLTSINGLEKYFSSGFHWHYVTPTYKWSYFLFHFFFWVIS